MKTCSYRNCPWPVFSHEYCKQHQWCRTDSKYKRSQEASKERSHISRYKIPRVSKKLLEERKGYSQVDLFNEIWNEMPSPRICPITRLNLDAYKGTDYWYSCFAHVLPKGKYPEGKLSKENILVIHPKAHRLIDQGTQKERNKYPMWEWDVFYNKREELKEKYG